MIYQNYFLIIISCDTESVYVNNFWYDFIFLKKD